MTGLRVAKGEHDIQLLPKMMNRHGFIAGATGTGKTVTLQTVVEQLSAIGVPCFLADVKGDLAGLSKPGEAKPKIMERLTLLGVTDPGFRGFPVTFWDVFGVSGHPIRATVSDMGPLLLSRLLNLNDTQTGVLTIVFQIADDNGLLLLDLKDLRSMLNYVGENSSQFSTEYGNVAKATIGAIQRGLLELERQGGDAFFGEPATDIFDLMQTGADGYGMINILAADKLMNSQKTYATFLLWLLAELFENLPEVGDLDKPRLAFFFDEAHLLFEDAPQALMEKIEQVVRLIRSKGVGVYFISQNPIDIPDKVAAQLGNRVQHALRAFTAKDLKAIKATAETFRMNAKLDVEKVITELAVGEALVSFLDEKGSPGIVERAYVFPPKSRIGPITPEERQAIIQQSRFFGRYEKAVDRESAYEMLKERAEMAPKEDPKAKKGGKEEKPSAAGIGGMLGDVAGDVVKEAARSAVRSVGGRLGRSITRGLIGTLLGGMTGGSSRRRR